MGLEFFLSICLGIGLAASVGFRVFLPLLVLSIAAYYNVIPLQDNWLWIGHSTTIVTLAVATVFEILAYYIPFFDNLLDTISVPLAAVAGTCVMFATMADVDPLLMWVLAIIAGGGTAGFISGTTSATRAASSATTGGIANPVVSTVETIGATTLSLTALIFPLLAFVFVIIIIFSAKKLYTKLFSKKKPVTR